MHFCDRSRRFRYILVSLPGTKVCSVSFTFYFTLFPLVMRAYSGSEKSGIADGR